MWKLIKLNEKGLTLLEVLIATVILAIVLGGFFHLFYQSVRQSSIIEDELTAIHLADEYIESYHLLQSTYPDCKGSSPIICEVPMNDKVYIIKVNELIDKMTYLHAEVLLNEKIITDLYAVKKE